MTEPTDVPAHRPGFPAWAWALLLLGICFGLFSVAGGSPGLLEQDEPRYAVTARNMARRGDWLVPEFNGRERLVKPPLAYWAIASSFRVLGREDEPAARLPSAVAGALAALLAALAGWRLWGPRTGRFAGYVLASMALFFVEARLATTDMLFTLLFTGAAAAWVPLLEGGARGAPCLLLSGLLAGLAALAKTPLAGLLPPIAALGAALLMRRPAEGRPPERGTWPRGRRLALLAAGGLGAFAAVFLAWYLAANVATEGRLGEELWRQVRMRTDPESDTHPGPFWYYLALLPAAVFPWALLLPAGVAKCLRMIREGGRDAATAAYALTLPAVVLVFFSALPSKLPAYVLPALPPLALVVAAGVEAMIREGESRAATLGRLAGGWGGVVLGAAVAALPWIPAVRERWGPEALRAGLPMFAVSGGLLAAAGMLFLARKAAWGLVLLPAVVWSLLLTGPPLLPYLETEKSARGLVQAMKAEGLAPGDRIYDAGNSLKGVPWYADTTTVTKPDGSSPSEATVAEALAGKERAWAIVEHDPAFEHGKGKKTQWERVLQRLPQGTPVPRVVFRGMGRIVVTNAPPR